LKEKILSAGLWHTSVYWVSLIFMLSKDLPSMLCMLPCSWAQAEALVTSWRWKSEVGWRQQGRRGQN